MNVTVASAKAIHLSLQHARIVGTAEPLAVTPMFFEERELQETKVDLF